MMPITRTLTAERDALGRPLAVLADASRRPQQLEAALARVRGDRILVQVVVGERDRTVGGRAGKAAGLRCEQTKTTT